MGVKKPKGQSDEVTRARMDLEHTLGVQLLTVERRRDLAKAIDNLIVLRLKEAGYVK